MTGSPICQAPLYVRLPYMSGNVTNPTGAGNPTAVYGTLSSGKVCEFLEVQWKKLFEK